MEQNDTQYLFYAAFEIRCGIEARMQEYLDVQEHVSKGVKKEWNLTKLSNSIS